MPDKQNNDNATGATQPAVTPSVTFYNGLKSSLAADESETCGQREVARALIRTLDREGFLSAKAKQEQGRLFGLVHPATNSAACARKMADDGVIERRTKGEVKVDDIL